MNELNDEDEQLIVTNFSRMKNDPIKQAKWLKEYERLKGVRQGSARQKVGGKFYRQLTQEDIAKELGVSPSTIRKIKRLDSLDPEIQQIIADGKITPSTGFNLIARLSEDEQRQLLEALPAKDKLTANEVQSYIDQIRRKDVASFISDIYKILIVSLCIMYNIRYFSLSQQKDVTIANCAIKISEGDSLQKALQHAGFDSIQ